MRYIIRMIEIILLLFFVAITVQNHHPVEFRLFSGQAWSAPFIVFLLLFFALGTAVGLLATLGYYLRTRKELSQLKKELRHRSLSKKPMCGPSDAITS